MFPIHLDRRRPLHFQPEVDISSAPYTPFKQYNLDHLIILENLRRGQKFVFNRKGVHHQVAVPHPLVTGEGILPSHLV